MALRLIQVGLGGWGHDWATHVIPTVPVIDRVAVVDADPATLAKAQESLGLRDDQCFSQLGAALDAVDADAVLVTATVAAHIPLAVQAIESGKHVLVEKPFAATVAEARTVVELAEQRGRTLMVSQNYRHFPAARTAARLVAEQLLGPVAAVRVDFRKWANDAPVGANRHYRLVHPLLYDMAIHHFDLMRLVLGQEPVRVYTQVTDPPWSNFTDEASAFLTITFDRGAVVSYRGSWVSPGTPTTWSGDWHLECERGEIYWTGRTGGAAVTDGETLRVRRQPALASTGAGRADQAHTEDAVSLAELPFVGRAGVLAEFARAVAEGDEPETSGRRNLGSLALAEAAARSAVSGQVEPVESA
ncbi:Gfo/Idh/MocA family protein [Actinopolymorpha alba]|uniref:Gfo/Idh/MocA family protein n=1 Tax=Actinopolymorpha alba TaxID=533267 RepID=UPI00037DA6E0|nr:Gfo/Idh/MocA family oxidoreductase [Actinopolymorpha alba]